MSDVPLNASAVALRTRILLVISPSGTYGLAKKKGADIE